MSAGYYRREFINELVFLQDQIFKETAVSGNTDIGEICEHVNISTNLDATKNVFCQILVKRTFQLKKVFMDIFRYFNELLDFLKLFMAKWIFDE